MNVNESSIFLLDGAGALLSVFLLGVMLPALQHWIGMPSYIFYYLATWAFGCLVYDLACFRFANHRDPKWLRGIMAANVLYCLLTVVLLVIHFKEMTSWGITYFLAEIPVILGLVFFERNIVRSAFTADG